MLHLAVDIGGTLTDICAFDEEGGATHVGKVSSTRDPIDAVFERMEAMGLFSQGTTVAAGAPVTRLFARAVKVTTEGFRAMIARKSTSHWENGAEHA